MAKHKAFKKKHKEPKHNEHKEEKHEKKHVEKRSSNSFWVWSSVILAIALVATIAYYTSKPKVATSNADIEKIANSTVNYINTALLQGRATAKLLNYSATKYPNLYKIEIEINGQKFDSYVTGDGKLLFPSAINVTTTKGNNQNEKNENKFDAPNSDVPDVKLFVMAYCPFGLQAEKAMIPVYNLLKDKANFSINYVIYSNYGNECLDNGTYCSMHGGAELTEDIRQMCILKNYGKDTLWKYLDKFDHECTYQNAKTCWEDVEKELGLNETLIQNCIDKEKTEFTMLKNEKDLDSKYNVRGSPTLIINGKEYSGGRSPEAFKEAVCSAFNTKPSECDENLSSESTSSGFGGGSGSDSGAQCN